MDSGIFDLAGIDISWCPGCGDFKILDSIKNALRELELTPHDVVMVSGIGQAAKTPHYMRSHFFNGLHGRALSNATAIKAANKSLKIIAIGGDGDMYGEGGNHFTHTIRRNPDITNLVFNNMVYGLTKGQASPTSPVGFRTSVQVDGVQSRPFNPLAASLVNGATFVARAFAGDGEQTKEIIKRAILHKGYSLVDIFQPCVSFNSVNTYKWFQENTYTVEGHDEEDFRKALELALVEEGPFPLGVLYRREGVPVFEDTLAAYRNDDRPLFRREAPRKAVKELIDSMCC
ncbi:MAG: thiamine pyrophosphate-dependent enzyme [Aminobacteriaceae bacterium]|uniref:thiamine pyrophosphate-dependent enzyme n=1 Tax=Aminivibrio sp. TaxID=1872489 RepID=UPI002A19B984|nr:thiamine pyrophosphate-dependent enzyme [Synergistaceae bacterium]MDD3389825.1 thiamine pyrophosphate-dependent enzyme [Synergistaceae bacterium]MDD4020208.1 thiamine pyrophosphate-dependent enzyme [Synergistaceae bacterium]MDD4612077.1 thiamine pyrophosphate-dependent enzyme [Synergistaceae bacterium]